MRDLIAAVGLLPLAFGQVAPADNGWSNPSNGGGQYHWEKG